MEYAKVFKWLSVILVIAVMIPAIGCGNGGNQVATSTPMATALAEPTGETGTLSDLDGDVQVQRQGTKTWIAATSGMEIWAGDSLKTGGDGDVITFFDGSVMEIQADSEISVEELNMASGTGSTTVRINQVLGNTLNRVENMVDSSSTYEVETLAGSAVVRGTIFSMEVDRDRGVIHTCVNTSKEEDEEVHSVDFSNRGKTVNVSEGKTSCCWEGGVPGNPFNTNSANSAGGGGGGGGGGSSCYGYGCTGYKPTPTLMPD